MKHYIIVKFKPEVTRERQAEMLPEIAALFGNLVGGVAGISHVDVCPNCVDRDNRFDLMIEIDMERDALTDYDNSVWHRQWKEKYGGLLAQKTIFDRE